MKGLRLSQSFGLEQELHAERNRSLPASLSSSSSTLLLLLPVRAELRAVVREERRREEQREEEGGGGAEGGRTLCRGKQGETALLRVISRTEARFLAKEMSVYYQRMLREAHEREHALFLSRQQAGGGGGGGGGGVEEGGLGDEAVRRLLERRISVLTACVQTMPGSRPGNATVGGEGAAAGHARVRRRGGARSVSGVAAHEIQVEG
eukprot:1579734-Rhodomonas_salina.2